jgi:hypothetical protein
MSTNQIAGSMLHCWALRCIWFAFSVSAFADAINGVTDNCTKGGTIFEANFFGVAKDFTVHITDKQNGGKEVESIHVGVIPSGGVARVDVPPPGAGIDHCDAFNTSVAVGPGGGGPGGVGVGAQQQLKMEVLFIDPMTLNILLGSIFDFLGHAYPSQTLFLPDLWADTNGDGGIGAGDQLYSLVDLNAYTSGGANSLAAVNARFSPGQQFSIVNGTVAGLPGMLFSTTPFTFSPTGGYQGTPYTGSGFAVTNHGLLSVPEPATLLLLGLGLVGLLARRR